MIINTCQNTLTKQWTRKIPLVQLYPPAFTACWQLTDIVNEVASMAASRLEIFEFCSGSGGPTPVFERLINRDRASKGEEPLQFTISDLHPNPKAWMEHTASSKHLRVIDYPIDAADPPTVAMSSGAAGRISFADDSKRIFRLFNLSFHHFDDEAAKKILRSTMDTAHAITIIELQDRRRKCMFMMLLSFLPVLVLTPIWFSLFEEGWRKKLRNLRQIALTFFPVWLILVWDGLASCRRTREFEEFVELVSAAAEEESPSPIREREMYEKAVKTYEVNNWLFCEHPRVLHTMPGMYVNMITGYRMRPG